MAYNRRGFLKTLALTSLALGASNHLLAADKTEHTKLKGADNAKNLDKTKEKQMRVLGNSGIKVSPLGLGCMSMTYALGPASDKKDMVKLIHQAVDLGVNFFDTAEVYGPFSSEEYVGEAFKKSSLRQKVVIATKFGVHYRRVNGTNKQVMDSQPNEIRRSIDGSLYRLKTDYIDLYYQHRIDPNVPIEEVAGVIESLIKEGKIRAWGLSEAGVQSIKKAHKIVPLSAVQSEYSLWWREPEKSLFSLLKELNIALVPFSPMGKGYLTGSLTKNSTFQKGDLRPQFPRFSKENLKKNRKLIDFIQSVAQSKKINGKSATNAQIALAWLLAQGNFIIPIPGTTKLAHLKENLDSLQIHFGSQELQEFNAKLDKIEISGDRYPAGSDMAKRVGK